MNVHLGKYTDKSKEQVKVDKSSEFVPKSNHERESYPLNQAVLGIYSQTKQRASPSYLIYLRFSYFNTTNIICGQD